MNPILIIVMGKSRILPINQIKNIEEEKSKQSSDRVRINKIPRSSSLWDEDLIDGIWTEEVIGVSNVENPINLKLNNSVKTVGIYTNITDINETREYIQNGDFDNDVNDWQLNDNNDVKTQWENLVLSNPGNLKLNLTGIENQHIFTKFNDSGDYEDDLESIGNWKFKNITLPEDPLYNGIYDPITPVPPDFSAALELSWCRYTGGFGNDGQHSGGIMSNFTYNGTNNLVDAELTFDYYMQIGSTSWNADTVGDLNLSVWIVVPNGTEFKIGNWQRNLHCNQSTEEQTIGSQSSWPEKSFGLTDLKQVFNATGNYTLKFRADHYHNRDGVTRIWSSILINTVKLTLNYTKKEYQTDDKIILHQNSTFGRLPRDFAEFNASFAITEPFTNLNNSGSEIFFAINDNVIFSQRINETEYNEWSSISYDLDNEIVNSEEIRISAGINFTDNVTFYPNQTWSLYLDNLSLVIRSTPHLEQIELQLFIPTLNKTNVITETDFGRGYSIIENASIMWIDNYERYPNAESIAPQNRTIQFLSNSTNITIAYNITKFGLSWRDTIYTEMQDIGDLIDTYLKNCRDGIIGTNFPKELFKDLLDILNYTSLSDYDEAGTYCSELSQQFEILYKNLLSTLNGTFYYNVYNVEADNNYFANNKPIECLSTGIYPEMDLFMDDIWSLIEYFNNQGFTNYIMETRFNALYGTYISQTENRLQDIKDSLTQYNLQTQHVSKLNLSAIYQSLFETKKSLENAINGLSTTVNIDPLNAISNWGCPVGLDPIILKDEFTGIYLGNLPTLIKMARNLYNNVFVESWKYTAFFDYIIKDSNNLGFNERLNEGTIPLLFDNFLGLFGDIGFSELLDTEFSFESEEADYSFTEFLSPNNPWMTESNVIEATDILYYIMMTILIEDMLVRKNSPLIMDYTFNSVLSLIEKTAIDPVGNEDWANTIYKGEVNVSIPATIDAQEKKYSDILIKNMGNDTSVRIQQKYYLPTSEGLYLIGTQTVNVVDLLKESELLEYRLPIQTMDNFHLKNLYSNIFGFENCSDSYFSIIQVYFRNKLMAESSSIIQSLVDFNENGISTEVNTKNTISNLKKYYKTNVSLNDENFNQQFNISDSLYSLGVSYNDIRDSLISLIIRRNPSRLPRYGQYFLSGEINGIEFSYNTTNYTMYNDFKTIKRTYIESTGVEILNFKVDDVLSEAMLDLDKENFEQNFIFNITANQEQFIIPLEINILTDIPSNFLPVMYDEFDHKISYSDFDDHIKIYVPFIECSDQDYFKIIVTNMNYEERYFSENYYLYNPSSKIRNNFYNLYIRLYPRKLRTISNTILYIDYIVKYHDGTEFVGQTKVNLEIYNIVHFKPAIKPYIFIVVIIGLLSSITALYLIRVYKRFYFTYLTKKSNIRLISGEIL
ncbi:MAG: hypothetical protein GF364_01265 [Candidatus Lokiarchaeota archaeon]|nr:hypothetical protein [Candidatus Lokiarchaeota archaeon]